MNRRSEFARVRERGESAASRYFVLATLADPTVEGFKVGFITSRRVGKAVTRNKIRRRFRSLLSKHGETVGVGRYVVMIARQGAAEASFLKLEQDWLRLAGRLGIVPRE